MSKMKKIKVLIVGCGDRATVYSEFAHSSGAFEFVAAVDPDDVRLKVVQDKFNVPKEMCFHRIDDVLKLGKIADCVINGTMDNLHIETAIPFLKQGYDMLLEKPITNNEDELLEIRDVAKEYGCKLLICHVLRYSPFYRKAKELILEGKIGDIMHIETSERVGVAHSSISYIRGKWNNEEECGSGMLLAKCCHDLDLLCWFNNTTIPSSICSFGGRNFFVEEKAPKGAGTRCLIDCPKEIREKCIFDVQPLYIDNDILSHYPWQCTGKNYWEVSKEEKIESLKTYNPHGQCAYKTNANIVDHQAVMIEFANGSTATHTMLSGAKRPNRRLYIQGTLGEIEGCAEDGLFVLRTFNKVNGYYNTETFNFNDTHGETGGHFGGDRGLVYDFMDLINGNTPSVSLTSIDDSINGHLCVFKAEESRKNKKIIYFEQ